MPYDPTRHHRRSIRLKGYDYTQSGAYFITIVTHERWCLFGEIVNGHMHLNDAGRMIEWTWYDLPNHIEHIELDAFVVMPNHVHGIIIIRDRPATEAGAGNVVGAGSEPAPTTPTIIATPPPTHRHYGLPEIVRQFQNILGKTHQPMARYHRAAGLATKLLRTHHPRRKITAAHSALYCRQPSGMGNGSRKPRIARRRECSPSIGRPGG